MTDREFVQRCLSRDKAAWDEFVDRYSRLIYNYIYRILNIKGIITSEDIANDLFQEIFLNLTKDNFHKLRQFKGKNNASLASWLRIITINFCLDYVKKKKPELFSLDEEDEEGRSLKDLIVDQRILADDALSNKERLKYLSECFDALDVRDRYIVEMHIYRRVNAQDLQSNLGVSRSAIDMRKTRIIQKLRDCLKKKGFKLEC